MFDLFKKKKSGDVIDYTLLEKKGLLKDEPHNNQNIQPQYPTTSSYDLPVPTPSPPQDASSPQDQQTTDFFSSMAASAEPSYQTPQSPIDTSYEQKDRIDKIEDRVEHILDRIYKILQRIEIMERKIERLERRSGLGRLETY